VSLGVRTHTDAASRRHRLSDSVRTMVARERANGDTRRGTYRTDETVSANCKYKEEVAEH
jgi:hypothetical protein